MYLPQPITTQSSNSGNQGLETASHTLTTAPLTEKTVLTTAPLTEKTVLTAAEARLVPLLTVVSNLASELQVMFGTELVLG